METRPTSDRLRETVFNILAPRLDGCRFADLYAGTGAVGIEAISRGAAFVYFTERAAPALSALRANLATLKIAGGFAIEDRGTGALLERLAKQATGTSPLLDLVYLDPPWEADAEYQATLHLLGSTHGRAVLAPGAQVVAEHSSKQQLADAYGGLRRTRHLKQGDAALSFYGLVVTETPHPNP
jgi:16S rRNA (guanine966-N2)-methyltransferase